SARSSRTSRSRVILERAEASRNCANASAQTMNPRGTGSPAACIRLRLAPFPPAMAGLCACGSSNQAMGDSGLKNLPLSRKSSEGEAQRELDGARPRVEGGRGDDAEERVGDLASGDVEGRRVGGVVGLALDLDFVTLLDGEGFVEREIEIEQ